MYNLECYVQLYCDGCICAKVPLKGDDKIYLSAVSLGNVYHYELTVSDMLNLLERNRVDCMMK